MGDKPTYEELEQRVKELEKAVVKHKLVEETLQKSEERLHYVLSAIPAVVYVCEPGGNYAPTYVSSNIKEQLGYEPHEFLEDPNFWADHIHPEDRQRVLEELPHMFGHDHHIHEYRFRHKQGMYKWMRDELRVMRDKQGKPLELVGYQVDITERRRMEEALRESEERFHQMAELSPFPVSIIDSDGRYLYLNRIFTEVFGYTLEDIPRGKDWFQKAYPDSEYRRKVLSALESDLEKIGRYEVRLREFRVTCKDGTVRDIIFRPVTTENGKQFITYQDLTGIRRAEMELRKQREELELLVSKRTVELNKVNRQLRHEINERKQTEETLRENTRRLEVAYAQSIIYAEELNEKITEHKRAEEALYERKEQLKAQAHELEEMNTALKVLLKQRGEDKNELEEKVLSNVEELVLPYVEMLKKSRLGAEQMSYVSIIESNLTGVVSPFLRKLSSKYLRLTPKEIQIADLIKLGNTNKQIAGLLNVSTRAVEFHRTNIRRKLGLKNKKANLRSYLLSIQ